MASCGIVARKPYLHSGTPRLLWTEELHGKFMNAVHKLGPLATPQTVTDMMAELGVTRSHVSSHWQKVKKKFPTLLPSREDRKRSNLPIRKSRRRSHRDFVLDSLESNSEIDNSSESDASNKEETWGTHEVALFLTSISSHIV